MFQVRTFVIAGMVVAFAGAPGAQAATADAVAISRSKEAVAREMRDPSSAQFRDVRVSGKCAGSTYVQGWANGKNGFGGYAGFMIFVTRVTDGQVVVMQAYGHAYASDSEFHTAAVCNGDAAR